VRRVILWMQQPSRAASKGPAVSSTGPSCCPRPTGVPPFTHPVVLGGGTRLFGPLERRLAVRSVEVTTFEPAWSGGATKRVR
jgi:hypothetical protein